MTPPSNRTPVKVKKGFPVLPFVLVGIILLGVVAVVLSLRNSSTSTSTAAGVAETRSVTVKGDDLAPRPSGGNDTAIGADAPELVGKSFDGKDVTIKPGGGTPLIVMFVAHWCPHCQREVPVVTNWVKQKGQPKGVRIMAVSTDVDKTRPNYPPSTWLTNAGFPFPVMADSADSRAGRAYGVNSFPFFAYIDKDGKVVGRDAGELPISDLEAEIATLTK